MSSRTVSNKLYGFERQLAICLALVLVMLFCLYVYFIGKSIVNVVMREEIELRIAKINSSLSDLEREYLSRKDAINLSYALARGFEPVSHKSFVSRGTVLGRGLSQNTERQP